MHETCPDCAVAAGEFHDLFCLIERCPFCGGQLNGCECIVSVLALSDADRDVVDEWEDETVEPLRGIFDRWVAALERKGRVPFGSEP